MLNIEMLSAVGDGASKKEAKHKAAEAMAYKLLPEVGGRRRISDLNYNINMSSKYVRPHVFFLFREFSVV